MARILLENVGFSVDLASNGAEAIALALSKGYCLILMDIQMPVLNGFEATREIRLMPGGDSIPILAMTANAFEDDRQACLEAGMDDHISKPVDAQQLYSVILKRLRRSPPHRE